MLSLRIASIAAVTLAFTACSAAGNAPAGTQAGASAPSAGFVPQSAPVGAAPAGAAATLDQPLPEPLIALGKPALSRDLSAPILNETGSYEDGAIIVGTNTASAGYGMEAITDGSGAGIYGHSGSASATSYGVYGFSGGGAGVYGYDDKTGEGVLGVSTSGNGVQGETSYNSSSASSFAKAGVLGEDLSTSGFEDAGVAGSSSSGDGVYGSSPNGTGVYAQSTQGEAIQALSTTGEAIGAISASGGAIDAVAQGGGPAVEAQMGNTKNPAFLAQSDGPSIETETNSRVPTMSLDGTGTMILAGSLVVDGSIVSNSPTAPLITGQDRDPQIERVGGGTLANGSAYVAIDADFAKRLDPTKTYRVFITPDGDSNQLYVTGKTSAGFTVRESHHGTSAVAFDYRIVGTPRQIALPHPLQATITERPLLRGPAGIR